MDAFYGETKLLDLTSLKNLTQLEWIDLEFIHLDDITPLAELKKLSGICLVSTKVEDIIECFKADTKAERGL